MTGRTHKTDTKDFLPVSREDMLARGWDWYDILLVTGDAYVDHPSFGAAVIGRLLENAGYRVAVLAQPAWNDASAFAAMGRPELGIFIGAGNLDSMVAHYTAAKKRRSEDFYSPGRKAGLHDYSRSHISQILHRAAARPRLHRVRQPRAAGVPRHPRPARRDGGVAAPVRALRLLGR